MTLTVFAPNDSDINSMDDLQRLVESEIPGVNASGGVKVVGAARHAEGGMYYDVYNWRVDKGTHGKVVMEGSPAQFARKALVEVLAIRGGRIEKNEENVTVSKSVENPSQTISIMVKGVDLSPDALLDQVVTTVDEGTAVKIREVMNPGTAEVNTKGKTRVYHFSGDIGADVQAKVSNAVELLFNGRIVNNRPKKNEEEAAA